jgi:ferredoxin
MKGFLLRVNPILCDGHGLCAELVPEAIEVDEWGYPIIRPGPIPASLAPHARRAVAACPVLALRLERSETGRRGRAAAAPVPGLLDDEP